LSASAEQVGQINSDYRNEFPMLLAV